MLVLALVPSLVMVPIVIPSEHNPGRGAICAIPLVSTAEMSDTLSNTQFPPVSSMCERRIPCPELGETGESGLSLIRWRVSNEGPVNSS